MSDAAKPILSMPSPQMNLGIGEIAAQLANLVIDGDLIFVATDEPMGIRITQALSTAVPDAAILFCPGSDALPGDDAPASPANVGRRVSTLLKIRQLLSLETRSHIACVTTGEALGRLYAPSRAFDTVLPRVVVGDAVDLIALYGELEEIGYVADERVDEPGEIALRGQVLDVYPADAEAPLRIEAIDGRVAAIRIYDPADQRTTAQCDCRELGRVAEPQFGKDGLTLLEHLPDARVILPAPADDHRKRFLALAEDANRRRPARAVRDAAVEAIWSKALSARDVVNLEPPVGASLRFVEAKQPLKAFTKAARAAIDAGQRVALLGSERDLRFIAKRVAASLDCDVRQASSWAEVAASEPGTVIALTMVIDCGFTYGGVLAVAASDLLGSRAERADTQVAPTNTRLFSFGEIRVGDVVVHEDHGIGVVAGLQRMPGNDGDQAGDAIALTFADNGSRLVPVADADRIWRYGAEEDAVTLDRLDGGSWEKRRGAIDAAIADSVRGLAELAAQRNR